MEGWRNWLARNLPSFSPEFNSRTWQGFFVLNETQIGPDHSLALETQRVACVWVATRDTTHPSLSRESVGLAHLQSVRGEAAIEREAALLLRGKRDVVALFKVRTHLPLRPRQLWALCIQSAAGT